MKKFLVILLIAIIACKTAEDIETEELIKSAQDLYNKLKKISGAIANIKKALKSGVSAAKNLCCSYVPSLCSFCSAVLNML